ncbi:MAG: MATE family efflux transporter [Chthoniobacteraceae bacterium]
MNRFSEFTREARATWSLALPLMAGQLSQMLMSLVDSAMVGRVGVVPLAAAAFAHSILGIFALLGIGLLTSVSVQAAQAHGRGRATEAGEVLRSGLILSLLTGTLALAIVWWLSDHLTAFGQPPSVATEARAYFLIVGGSLTPAFLLLTLKQFSEALSHPVPPMLIMIGSVFLNAILNWFFIYGHGGLPAMGLAGAGWATLLARVIAFLALLAFVARARRFSHASPLNEVFRVSMARVISMLKIGGPSAITLLLEASAFSATALMMGWIGTDALAAHQIAFTCAATTFMLPLGISMATTIRVGQAIGAGEVSRVRRIGNTALGMGALIMALCGIAFAFTGHFIAKGFVDDPAVTALAAKLLLVAALFQVFDGLQVIAAGALRGLEDVNVPMAIGAAAYWGLALPAAYFLAFRAGWGPVGIWSGLVGGLGAAALLLVTRFVSRARLLSA